MIEARAGAPRTTDDVRRVWLVRVAILASIALSGAALVGAVIARLELLSAPVPSVLGLRLGISPDELRARRSGGEWTTRLEASGDLSLSRGAERYEFHEGMLVAVELELPAAEPDAAGPPIVVTPVTVLVREPTSSGVRVRMISRTCPTHAGEAERLAATAPE